MASILNRPGALLRIEGAAVFLLVVFVYGRMGSSWLLFVLLFLAPDVSMLGYLAGPRTGASIYNLIHTYSLSVILFFLGVAGKTPLLLPLSLILFAHIAMDRLLGFGLKYPSGFKETHLEKV
jgi:hypothetical protein